MYNTIKITLVILHRIKNKHPICPRVVALLRTDKAPPRDFYKIMKLLHFGLLYYFWFTQLLCSTLILFVTKCAVFLVIVRYDYFTAGRIIRAEKASTVRDD